MWGAAGNPRRAATTPRRRCTIGSHRPSHLVRPDPPRSDLLREALEPVGRVEVHEALELGDLSLRILDAIHGFTVRCTRTAIHNSATPPRSWQKASPHSSWGSRRRSGRRGSFRGPGARSQQGERWLTRH